LLTLGNGFALRFVLSHAIATKPGREHGDKGKGDKREARHKPEGLGRRGELRNRTQRIRNVRRDRKPNVIPMGIGRDRRNRLSR
jgi:hypothetical protein